MYFCEVYPTYTGYYLDLWVDTNVRCAKKKKIIKTPSRFKTPTMQFRVLSILSVLVTSTVGRPRIESSNSNSISNGMSNINSNSVQTDLSSTKRPLSACEEAIYSCCSSQWSTFLQSARCFELNNCPGINFIVNPCFGLPSVINRI